MLVLPDPIGPDSALAYTRKWKIYSPKIGDKANIRHLRNESIKLQAAFIAVAAGAAWSLQYFNNFEIGNSCQ